MIRRVKLQERSDYSVDTQIELSGMTITVKAGRYTIGKRCLVEEDTSRTLELKATDRSVRINLCLEKGAKANKDGFLRPKIIIDDLSDSQHPAEVDTAHFSVWELGRISVDASVSNLDDVTGSLYVTT